MPKQTFDLYEPLFEPKPVGDEIWLVDGPEIQMDYVFGAIPATTRMVIVRLDDGRLWLHSPIAANDQLIERVKVLGEPAYLVAPNSIHYWFLPDWRDAFPNAKCFAVPGLEKAAKRPLVIDETLRDTPPPEWANAIDQALVPGSVVTEAVFHHRASQTLVLTDLIENFELSRIKSRWWRTMLRLAGVVDPDGKAPIDLRATFRPHRKAVRERVQRMIEWAPEKVIMAHGRPYLENGTAELHRAFKWAGA